MQIIYNFNPDSASPRAFAVTFDPRSIALQVPERDDWPEWTRLEHRQCAACPLSGSDVERCPMAVALIDLHEFAGGLDSYAPLIVSVVMPERSMQTAAPAQRAVSSLMGLLIATCGCPDVAWLRPMARFHLPLASEEETIYRATSMYLLAQYFRGKSGQTPDLSLAGLSRRYQRLHEINIAMAARLRDAAVKDASVNAVVLLDLFAKAMPYSVNESVSDLEYLFQPLDTTD